MRLTASSIKNNYQFHVSRAPGLLWLHALGVSLLPFGSTHAQDNGTLGLETHYHELPFFRAVSLRPDSLLGLTW